MGTPLTGASNVSGVGRNRDSEPICLLLTLQLGVHRIQNVWIRLSGSGWDLDPAGSYLNTTNTE